MTTVYFFHGSMSSPQSRKIQAMKPVAESLDFTVNVPNHSEIRSADERVAEMLKRDDLAIGDCYLVGSSMGGYVATALSDAMQAKGLFLMAPAFYLEDYAIQNPEPHTDKVTVIHGWHDDVVPLANGFQFAKIYSASMHIVDDGHSLRESIPQICDLFRLFLSR